MIKRLIFATALASTAIAAVADNREGFYAGGGITYINSGVAASDGGDIGFTTIEFYGGYKYNDYIGGELRVGTGLNGDDNTVNDVVFENSISHYESIYYRIESINQVAKIYGLLGYTNLEVDIDSPTGTDSGSDSGASWGVGVGFVTSPNMNLNFEYKTILQSGDNDFTGISVNLDYRF